MVPGIANFPGIVTFAGVFNRDRKQGADRWDWLSGGDRPGRRCARRDDAVRQRPTRTSSRRGSTPKVVDAASAGQIAYCRRLVVGSHSCACRRRPRARWLRWHRVLSGVIRLATLFFGSAEAGVP
jgi:hypothetical protein